MLHYAPQHVSSSTLLILRRTNCVTTASGILTLEIGERSYINLYRTKVTFAVTQVKVKYLKDSGRQWTYRHLNAVQVKVKCLKKTPAGTGLNGI
jgi:hypothetical protein